MNVALRPERLDLLSICTGGGGLDLGIELAIPGARSVCMVEREAFAAAELVSAMEAGHLAPAAVWSDARTFDGRRWRGCVDGLIGGIPCQPHSMAGRKGGQHDPRDLWSTARRIIVQSRCWFVLIENVSGMLSPGADEVAGAERVWRDLRKLGFQVEGGLFTAAEVGASHERERVFILGVADGDDKHGDRTGFGWPGRRGQSPDGSDEVPGVGLADAYDAGSQGRRNGTGPVGRQGAERHAGLGGGELAHTSIDNDNVGTGRSGERYGPDELPIGGHGGTVVDAIGSGYDRRADDAIRRSVERTAVEGASVGLPLFCPPPGALRDWLAVLQRAPELEPAFRRVADGLASRLDIARVDRLRLLGNGVVPLAAAYAVSTLATRLATRGSAGAARLVRMMEAA